MAVSIPVCSVGPRVGGIPRSSNVGQGFDKVPRSLFWGSGSSRHLGVDRKNQVVAHNVSKRGAIRSASFFEKLGQLFFGSAESEEQVLAVYEINDLTGYSPAALNLTPKKDAAFPTLGDLVPYTNKVYDASGKKLLGFSAGLCTGIRNGTGVPAGDFYETTYTHYLGDYGHLSAMGPYYTIADCVMVVTGGTGIFKGAQGTVTLHSVKPPTQILYTYNITGIAKLPAELTIPLQSL